MKKHPHALIDDCLETECSVPAIVNLVRDKKVSMVDAFTYIYEKALVVVSQLQTYEIREANNKIDFSLNLTSDVYGNYKEEYLPGLCMILTTLLNENNIVLTESVIGVLSEALNIKLGKDGTLWAYSLRWEDINFV